MIVDLFAGPGGWDKGAELVGLEQPWGYELDDSALATRAAAGLRSIPGDIAEHDPWLWDEPTAEGVIASPPCPAFSQAGKREGIEHIPALLAAIRGGAWSERPSPDPRVWLALEVGRWVEALQSRWVACEQVPEVLPLWRAYEEWLQARGYSTWSGILEAERYGVPQTRDRAILMASLDRQMQPPAPTHQRYVKGEPARHEVTMFGELLPWVSMAEALGWDGFEARYKRGAGMTERYGPRPSRPSRPSRAPAPTLTGAALGAGGGAKITLHTNRGQDEHGARQTRCSSAPAPAPAPTAKAGGQWAFERPATTVQGDPRIGNPGHRDRAGGEPQFSEDALRLSVEDALRLQSFPADYPVQGTKTKQFEQIGNAIPPLLAAAILRAVAA